MSKKIITHNNGIIETRETFYTEETIQKLKQQLEEKDKEIEDWKNKTQTFFNIVNQQNYEIANNNPTQLAMQELEKVKSFVKDTNGIVGHDWRIDRFKILEAIDNQIKELNSKKSN